MVLNSILDMTKGLREAFLIPCSLILIFICIFLFYKNRKDFIIPFKSIKKKTWIILGFIILLSIGIRLYFPIGHRMYFDEFDYMANAKQILNLEWGFTELYQKEPILVPIIYSFSFLVFGISNQTAIYTSLAFGVLSVFLLFLFVYYLTKNEKIALVSSFFLSILAEHVMWCTSAERNVISLFFLLLSLLLSFMFVERKKSVLLILTICSMSLASLTRTENHVSFFLLIPLFLIYAIKPKKYLTKKNIAIILLIAILMTPNFINQLELFFTHSWSNKESKGEFEDNFSLGNLMHNSKIDLKAIFFPDGMNILVNVLLIILLVLGAFLFFFLKPKEFVYILIFLIIFYLAYFLAWPTVQARSRFYLTFYLMFIIFLSFGIFSIYKLRFPINLNMCIALVLILAFVYAPYLALKYQEHRNSYFVYQTASVIDLIKTAPKDCTIVAFSKNFIQSTSDLEVLSYAGFVMLNSMKEIDFSESCFILYCGIYCKQKVLTQSNAYVIMQDYNLLPIKDYSIYVSIYKILNKRTSYNPLAFR